MNLIDDRDWLLLNLESFLREKYRLHEEFKSVSEDWDARGDAVFMVFRYGSHPAAKIMRAAPMSEFNAWLLERGERPMPV